MNESLLETLVDPVVEIIQCRAFTVRHYRAGR